MIVNRGREYCTDPITVDDGRDKYGIGGISYSFLENVLPSSPVAYFVTRLMNAAFFETDDEGFERHEERLTP